jgi:hypothetical protein
MQSLMAQPTSFNVFLDDLLQGITFDLIHGEAWHIDNHIICRNFRYLVDEESVST